MEGEEKYRVISNHINSKNDILIAALKNAKVSFNPFDLEDSKRIVRFISFLYNIGFIEQWGSHVEFQYFPGDKEKDLLIYKGSRTPSMNEPDESYVRYTTIHKLIGNKEQREGVLSLIFDQLLSRAPVSHKTSPLFIDNELKEIFLNQLAENVASHTQAVGYVMSRTFSAEDLKTSRNPLSIIPLCSAPMQAQCLKYGFFEIIISDNGSGIFSTLEEAYDDVLDNVLKIPNEERQRDVNKRVDVIQFALDEFGSRYVQNKDKYKALIDKHSLNQVFQYTRKYGGSLRIISDGICVSFDTCEEIKRGKYGLGFLGKCDEGSWPENGLHLRILLPHNPNVINEYPKARKNQWPLAYPLEKIYPLFRYLGSELPSVPSESDIVEKASEITQWGLSTQMDQLALDFSETHKWHPDLFIVFLYKLENLISRIHCWGVNVPENHISTLKSRWYTKDALSIPEEKLLSFPCLDNAYQLHLISKELFPLSEGLALLFNGYIDNMGKYIGTEYYTISDIYKHLREKSINGLSVTNYDEVTKMLTNNPHLFKSKGNNQWTATIDLITMRQSADKTLSSRFEEILKKSESIHNGINSNTGKEKIFEVPSTGKFVKEYIWTYRLLQVGTYTDEIARRLKNALDNYFKTVNKATYIHEIGAIICATAPARILAEAISKLYISSPTVFDLGAINDLDPEDIMSSFKQDNVKNCIIVTDVLDTNTLIRRIINIAEKNDVDVIAIASIIRFVNNSENRWIASTIEETFERNDLPQQIFYKNKKNVYPIAILYDYPTPEKLADEPDPKKHEIYWIEPYSLSPFNIDTLIKPYFAWEKEERAQKMPDRIALLDKKKCILFGHFKNKNHHNRILINMTRALQDEELTNMLFNDIIDFMGENIPDVIVVPLQSSINYFIPYFKNRLREKSIYRPVICTIAVDLKGRGPWYLLPKEAQNILSKLELRNLMFLDDAILTGRTEQTFLRSIERYIHQEKKTNPNFKIDNISIYCFINRIGRAASTQLKKSGQFCGASFKFREFVRFESPVYTPYDCPLCKDQKRLKEYINVKQLGENRVTKWVNEQMEELEPIVTFTKKHKDTVADLLDIQNNQSQGINDFLVIDSAQPNDTLATININNPRVQSIDGALWWFWERGYRGSPPMFLLNNFNEWLNLNDNIENNKRDKLLSEVLIWALDNHKNLKFQSLGNDIDYTAIKNHIFFKLLNDLLNGGGNFIPVILERAGMVLLDRKNDIQSPKILIEIFSQSLNAIEQHHKADAVASIVLGLYLIIIRTKINNMLKSLGNEMAALLKKYVQPEFQWQGYFQNILSFLECESTDNDFQYALNLLLKERLKKRHGYFRNLRINFDRTKTLEDYRYMIDVAYGINSAINIVFPVSDKDESSIKYEIQDLKSNLIRFAGILEKKNTDYDKLQEVISIINYFICESSRIGEGLDQYNSSIYAVFEKLRNDIKLQVGSVEIYPTTETGIKILGKQSSLRDTLKNHIWDVLKMNTSSNTSKIRLKIEDLPDGVNAHILNNFQTHSEATGKIKQGNSFAMEQIDWARYGAELHYPEVTDEDGFLSRIVINFQKGLKPEG